MGTRKTYFVRGGQYVRQQLDLNEPVYYKVRDFDYYNETGFISFSGYTAIYAMSLEDLMELCREWAWKGMEDQIRLEPEPETKEHM